jgi:hypothetical protein
MKLSWENLESTVRELALADPEYVDKYASDTGSGCKYTPDGSYKGCIIGQALTKLGATPAQLLRIEGQTPSSAEFSEIFSLPHEGPAGEPPLATAWNRSNQNPTAIILSKIQSRQDTGWDWEGCVS